MSLTKIPMASRFFKDVVLLASGYGAAQLIALAFIPIATRIFGPEAFGTLGTLLAMVSIGVPFVVLGYSVAILLPEHDREAIGLVRIAIGSSLILTFLGCCMFFLRQEWLRSFSGSVDTTAFIFLLSFGILLSSWVHIAQQWLTRQRDFRAIGTAAVSHSLALCVLQASLGLLAPQASNLLLATVLALAIHLAVLARATSIKSLLSPSNMGITQISLVKELARRYRDFPFFRAPQMMLNAISQSVPVLVLASIFGTGVAGLFALTRMVLGAPSNLVSRSVGDVFYAKIAIAARQGEGLISPIVSTTAWLTAICAPPFLAIIAFGPSIFASAFGSDWETAGHYATWLSAMYLLSVINKPCVASIPVLGLQRGLLVYEILSIAARMLALLAGHHFFDSAIVSIAMFSLTGVVAYLSLMVWVIHAATKQERKYRLAERPPKS